jgi:hypothetical protein
MSALSDAREHWRSVITSPPAAGHQGISRYFLGFYYGYDDHREPFVTDGIVQAVVDLNPDREELIDAIASTIAKAEVDGLKDRGAYFRACIERAREPVNAPDVVPTAVFLPQPTRHGWLTPTEMTAEPLWVVRIYPNPGMPDSYSKHHAVFDIEDHPVTACGVEWQWTYPLDVMNQPDPGEVCKSCVRALGRGGFSLSSQICTCETAGVCQACRIYDQPGLERSTE